MTNSSMVSETRLSGLMTASGFCRALRRNSDFAWNRWNSLLGLSEWVFVGFAGKKNEAVSVNVGVGITRVLGFGVKQEVLMEVADVKEMLDEYGFWIPGRGQAIIETAERAKAWERQVAEIAPASAQSYALQHGNELLQRTAHARQHSLELLGHLDSTKSLYQQIQEFEAQHGHTFPKGS